MEESRPQHQLAAVLAVIQVSSGVEAFRPATHLSATVKILWGWKATSALPE
jgi:hypothetical protein